MRTNEFRGLRTDGKGWAYGSILQTNQSIYIVPIGTNEVVYHGHDHVHHSDLYKVNPSTIGQFTGLYDRNGVKIWEGDVTSLGAIVVYDRCRFCLKMVCTQSYFDFYHPTKVVITGNIHEPAHGSGVTI